MCFPYTICGVEYDVGVFSSRGSYFRPGDTVVDYKYILRVERRDKLDGNWVFGLVKVREISQEELRAMIVDKKLPAL